MLLKEYEEILNASINNMRLVTISIPDIYTTPHCISPVVLNYQQYYFEYNWNTRSELLYLSIYTINNNVRNYFVKNISLINNIKISDYITNQNWDGLLQFTNINDGTDISYTIKDVSKKFYLMYWYSEV